MNTFKRILKAIFPTSWKEIKDAFVLVGILIFAVIMGFLFFMIVFGAGWAFSTAMDWLFGPKIGNIVVWIFSIVGWIWILFGDIITRRFKETKCSRDY